MQTRLFWLVVLFFGISLAASAQVPAAKAAPSADSEAVSADAGQIDVEQVEPDQVEPNQVEPNQVVTPEEQSEKQTSAEGESPVAKLIMAAGMRDREAIKDLLASGVDVNSRSELGNSAWLEAKMRGNEGVAGMLEALGAKPHEDFDPAEFISTAIKKKAKADHPGLAILVSRGDDILLSAGFGLANLEHEVPITTETKFRIGSVTKQFTAAAILKLQEEGKLKVTDTLDKYVPDLPNADKITLHHLLTHTSGLKNFTSEPDFYETVASSIEASEMVDRFKTMGADSGPGEKFAYCNTGYFLLGYIVEQVSDMSFDEYLQTTFFEPLGMENTGVHTSKQILVHEASGYSLTDDGLEKALDWDMSRAGGAGNLYSTVGDLHKWNRAIFAGKVLNTESLAAAHTVNEGSGEGDLEIPYGYGWIVDEHRGLRRIGHSGGLHGFVSQLNHYPEPQVTIALLHNAMPSIPELAPGAVCDRIAEVFLWQEMKPRPKHVEIEIDPDTLDDYVGQYDYQSALMTITREDDKLMAQLSGQPKLQVFPEAKDRFFWKAVTAQIEFFRDDDGNVTSARHSQGIAKFNAPRVKERVAVELSEEVLERFVGNYRYAIGATLTIRRDGSKLLAKLTGQPEMEVFTESDSTLFWKIVNAQLKFSFDDDGNFVDATHQQSGRNIAVTKVD